jgi:hypothetical protein
MREATAARFRKIIPFGVSLTPKFTLVSRAVVLGLGLGLALVRRRAGGAGIALFHRRIGGGGSGVGLALLGCSGLIVRYVEGRVALKMRRYRERATGGGETLTGGR